jgi:PleD family two-component response regulator
MAFFASVQEVKCVGLSDPSTRQERPIPRLSSTLWRILAHSATAHPRILDARPFSVCLRANQDVANPCPTIRSLVVDDYEPIRHHVRAMLQARAEFQVIGEASDGLEAVQKAEELQPDLILLDIGLPTLNGLEAAHRISVLVPNAILYD